jgi:molybdopterin biosynthesis enzyme
MNPPAENAQRIARLAPLAEILLRVEALARPLEPHQVPIDRALGATLAADVIAPAIEPSRPMALRDGWAVRADRVADAGPYSPVVISAAPPWVEVGDVMPPDADAVLRPDMVTVRDMQFEAVAAATPGAGVLAPGWNTAQGAKLCSAGERLSSSDCAALGFLGVERVAVRQPNLRIGISDVSLGHKAIGHFLSRAAAAAGAHTLVYTSFPIERIMLAENADIAFVVGGTGEGQRDQSVTALARVGEVAIHGFGIAPGETGALGSVRGRPVLLFPGRLDAALAVWLLVGAPLVARLAGAIGEERGEQVTLARKIASPVGIAEVVPVRRAEGGVEPLGSAPLALSALAQADGWVLVPPESEGFPARASVTMRALP